MFKKNIFLFFLFLLIINISLINSLSVTYNFSSTYQGINMWAYDSGVAGDSGSSSIPPANSSPGGTHRDITTNAGLDISDDTDVITSPSSGYAYFQFIANVSSIDKSQITKLNWTWEGSVYVIGTHLINLYLWNSTGNSWFFCGNYSTTYSTDITTNCNASILSNVSDFINSTSYINFITQGVNSAITVDFVQLEIIYDGLKINSPTSSQEILNNLSTTLNTSQTGYNNSVWYTWNNGIKNNTLCTNSNECSGTITFPRQGYYNLTVYGNKSDGTITSQSVSNLFVGNSTVQENANINITAGNWNYIEKAFDGNYSTYANPIISTGYAYINYTILNKNLLGALWEIKDGAGIVNLTIPNDCINKNYLNLSVKDVYSGYFYIYWYCYNFSSNSDILLRTNNVGEFYEEHIIWKYYSSNFLPSITLTLLNNTNQTTRTVNFTYNISDDNDYLNNISLYIDNIINTTIYNQWINNSINNSLNFSIANIADGNHTYFIRAFDSDGVIANSSTNTFIIDTTPPVINILYPVDYQSFDHANGININFTRSDATMGLDKCWWSNESGKVNITLTNIYDNITVTESGDGSYRVDIWCNDTLSNLANSSINYVVNTVNPLLNLNKPSNNQWLNYKNNTIFNFTILDAHQIDTCELWGNWTGSWSKNQSIIGVSNNSVITNFGGLNLTDGNYIWNVKCNESNNLFNWNAINWTINLDTIYPNLNISYPQNTTYTTNQLPLNFSSIDTNLKSCWYNINNSNNITITSCNNITFTANEGDSRINLYTNDSANNVNSTTVDYFVDSIMPSITYNASFSNNSYLNYNSSIKINLTITDTNLKSCWYNVDRGSNTTITCGTNLSLNLSEAFHTVYFFANDTLNNVNNTEKVSFTTDVTYPVVNVTSVTTTLNSQTVTIYHSETDTNLNTCKYSIFNSTGGIDGVYNNLSITCNSAFSATVSDYGTFNVTIYGIDYANNENKSTKSFTTSFSTLSVGGGGTPALETSTVAIKQQTEAKSRDKLKRAILYARIREYCLNKTGCYISSDEQEDLKLTMNKQDLIIDNEELKIWLRGYNNNDLEAVKIYDSDISKYNLFTGVLQVIGQVFQVSPKQFDRYWIVTSDTFKDTITSNKELKSCSVVDAELGWNCSISNSTAEIILKIPNYPPDWISKTFSATISYTSKDGENFFQPATIRGLYLSGKISENLPIPFYIVLIIASSSIILFLIFRVKIIKKFKEI